MNPYKTNDPEALGKLYKLIQQLDRQKRENKRFRKTIDSGQIVLEDYIYGNKNKKSDTQRKNK